MTTGKQRQDYWDGIGQQWKSKSDSAFWRQHSDAVNQALIGEWWPAREVQALLKTDLFDEAVASGLYHFLAERGGNMTGVDLSPVIVKMAQDRYPELDCLVGDVRCLPFETATFDLVISNSTLDHFDSKAEISMALRELFRVLKPGSEMILTLDNPYNPVVALRNFLPDRWLKALGALPYDVGATLGPRRLRRVLTEVGFEIAELRPILHYPRVLAVHAKKFKNRGANQEDLQDSIRQLMAWERMSRWPTGNITGYFIAARATKPA